jgi:release factor glutamine methyltransferase
VARDPLVKPKDEDPIRILDLGTGSACLVLTLLSEIPNATAIATDISDAALHIANQNAEKHELTDRIQFIKSDWFESVKGMFDIIISNPPYIESDDIPNLDKNVREFDPLRALDGGADGLSPYKVILPQIRNYLKPNGLIALEHGLGQGVRIKRLIENAGLSDIQQHYDLGGRDRVITAIHK